MPDGDLRVKIMSLQEGSKKKVRKIYIYDESKKSTSKNAFLLKFLWHREFGIADNFMNENEEEELLAVLSLSHVHKVYDDYAAHVTQAHLPRYLTATLYVDLQCGILLSGSCLDMVATIDVDDMHRLRVLNINVYS